MPCCGLFVESALAELTFCKVVFRSSLNSHLLVVLVLDTANNLSQLQALLFPLWNLLADRFWRVFLGFFSSKGFAYGFLILHPLFTHIKLLSLFAEHLLAYLDMLFES